MKGWGNSTMDFITLDFDGIKSLWTLHEYFKEVFNLPDYYGHNMDALWDCLDCSFEVPTTIVLRNIAKIPSEMSEAVEIMLELFDDLQRENEEVTIQIESSVLATTLPTSFDMRDQKFSCLWLKLWSAQKWKAEGFTKLRKS